MIRLIRLVPSLFTRMSRRMRALAAVAFAAVLAAGVVPAVAADSSPTVSAQLFDDDVILVVGKHFTAGSIDVLAEVEGGHGSYTATANSKGVFVAGFSLPTDDFTGEVHVVATQAGEDYDTIYIVGGAAGSTTTTTKKPASTTTVKPAATTTTKKPSATTTTQAPASGGGSDGTGTSPGAGSGTNPSTGTTPGTTTGSRSIDKSKQVKIMAFGDSIIAGHSVPGGARIGLDKTFKANGYNVDWVGSQNFKSNGLEDGDNEGYSGWEITRLLPLIKDDMAKFNPDVVMISDGGNDMMHGQASGVEQRYRDQVTAFCTAKPGIYLALATNHNLAAYQSQMDTLNGIIKKVASDMNTSTCHITLVNQSYDYPLADGLHPTLAGYNQMADRWYPALQADVDKVLATK